MENFNKTIVVASGKGGTGKTLLSVSLARYFADQNAQVHYIDADVEEPNGGILLQPQNTKTTDVFTEVPELQADTCSACGKCQQFCAFNAIIAIPGKGVMVFPELCHGCPGCVDVCPEDVLKMVPRKIGTITNGKSENIDFTEGRLNEGEAMPTPVLTSLFDYTRDYEGLKIIDSPPGTSCSVMKSMEEGDLIVLTTEPTPFGFHDVRLASELALKIGKPVYAVINRSDLGNSEKMKKYFYEKNIPVLGEIPFSKEVAVSYSKGQIPDNDDFVEIIEKIAQKIVKEAEK